ncbi:hypothetical protein DFH07DRAFT_763401, partial [Mycena maculata]
LTQLHTAHIDLNAFLFRFHLAPPQTDCALCLVPETVPHFLLACPRFRPQRLALIMRLGTARLQRLLATKSDPPKAVLVFARDTDRFPTTRSSAKGVRFFPHSRLVFI